LDLLFDASDLCESARGILSDQLRTTADHVERSAERVRECSRHLSPRIQQLMMLYIV
jgi:hypothetical protein